jgi:hypothetical protein
VGGVGWGVNTSLWLWDRLWQMHPSEAVVGWERIDYSSGLGPGYMNIYQELTQGDAMLCGMLQRAACVHPHPWCGPCPGPPLLALGVHQL